MTNKEMILQSEEELIRALYLIGTGHIDILDCCDIEIACSVCKFNENGNCGPDERICPPTYLVKSWLEAPANQNTKIKPCKELIDHAIAGYDGIKDLDRPYCLRKDDNEKILNDKYSNHTF